jgi:hypothetical protein
MPPFKSPPSLIKQTSAVLASLSLHAIYELETFGRSAANEEEKDAFHRSYRHLLDYFESLPSPIIHAVIAQSVHLYTTRCKRLQSETEIAAIVQVGVEKMSSVISVADKVVPPLLSLFRIEVTPSVTLLDFTGLTALGTLTDGAFATFNQILGECLLRVPCLQHLDIKSPHSRTSLPTMLTGHLKIIGTKCPMLKYIDISFITGLRNEDLLYLIPNVIEEGNAGCPKLEKLFLYDCGFGDRAVRKIAKEMPSLRELGYKEMGKVLKKIHQELQEAGLEFPRINFVHINNIGAKIRKTAIPSLRCRRPIITAINELCPDVENVKFRVQDADVEHLSMLKNLRSVELLFNVGRPTTPAMGTQSFIVACGTNLTSLAIICSSISMVHINMIGQNCPSLQGLWLRSNHFQMAPASRDVLPEDMASPHRYFSNLKTLYFRVGEGELALTVLPHYVLPYILRNANGLKELIVAIRCYIITDEFICNLLIDHDLRCLEKLLIVVPGVNNMPNVIPLTLRTVSFVLEFCQNMKRLGNIMSWTLNYNEFERLKYDLNCQNYDIDLIYRKMNVH